MNYQIADGSTVDIQVGMFVLVKPGIFPAEFESKPIEITQVDASYPHFFDGVQHSCIEPSLILEVANA